MAQFSVAESRNSITRGGFDRNRLSCALDPSRPLQERMATSFLALTAFSVLVGALIGAAGIGGVLLVPFMAFALGIEIHRAIPAAMCGYVLAGAVAAVLYARQGAIRWRDAGWLAAGAMPAALLGSFAASASSVRLLEAGIAALLFFAGYNALRRVPPTVSESSRPAALGLAVIGAVTGFGSAMTGTGGPLILVPLLLWLRFPVLAAVGLSQAIQAPLATLATVGNVLLGVVEFGMGVAVALGLTGGVVFGARLAHAAAPETMKRVVAWIVIVVAVFVTVRLNFALFPMLRG